MAANPALAELLEVARSERDKQLAHFDSLDNKAGLVVGFAGLLIPLTPSLPSDTYVLLTLAFAGAAISWAVAAFWPSGFPTLRLRELREYLHSDPDDTVIVLYDTMEAMASVAQRLLAAKTRRLKWSLLSLGAAGVTIGVGLATEALS